MAQMHMMPQSPQGRLAESLGQAIGGAGGNYLGEQIAYQRNRGRLQQALGEVGKGPKSGSTPLQTTLSFLNAMAGIPGSERYVGQILPTIIQQAQAAGSQNVQYTPGEPQQTTRQPREQLSVPQRQPLPNLRQGGQDQINNFFPTNVGPQEAPGNLPQAATEGLVKPVLDAPQLFQEGKRIAAERTANSMPTSVEDGYKIAQAINEENKLYNREVEVERQARISAQEQYGNKAVEKLTKLMPGATDEQQAIFKKIGENIAGKGKSEADIDRTLAKEATKFKNTISNIETDLSAPRSYNALQRKFLGTDKDFKQAAGDLRVKLKPLLDLGLYDTSRNLLEKLGYYPEERESIVNPLSDQSNAILNLIPEVQKEFVVPKDKFGPIPKQEPTANQIQNLRSTLSEVFKKDPNASLVLVRKAVEDRGYDWRTYKDTLNEMIQSEEFNPTDDQFNQLNYLDTHPLNQLESILHSLKIIGR